MNRAKHALMSFMRSSPLRGEDGRVAPRSVLVLVVVLIGLVGIGAAAQKNKKQSANRDGPTRSTTIALTSDEQRLVVVNREANSVSIIRVKDANGNDVATKIVEIGVGEEPRCVAVHPTDQVAYVTNGISGTVSVVDLVLNREVEQIKVGTEPRGCALTPDGSLLYVANHTQGTVSILVVSGVDPRNLTLDGSVTVGRNPTAIAITDKGPPNISDNTVFVTQIFAELDPNFVDPFGGEARDLGKRGVVHAFPAGNSNPPITQIYLTALSDSGFTSNRTQFCPNLNTNPAGIHPADVTNPIFCPDPAATVANATITANPQGVFPNQLLSALIRGNRLYLPNIGAQPEPVERFDANVQALVHNVDTNTLAEVTAEHVNLNQQIDRETAAPPPSLDKTFGNDIVAIDANEAGDTFLIVSRGGNQVLRATLDPAGQLNVLNAAGTGVDCRIQTGNLPSGVAMRRDGTRGYANTRPISR